MIARPEPDAPDSGFSLVEVLVAFAILSLGLVTVYAAFSLHLRSAGAVQVHQRTLAEATAHLDMLIATTDLDTEPKQGVYRSGAPWRLTVTPIAIAEQSAIQSRPVRVRLEAFDARGRSLLELSSIALVRGPP
jgi:general secretion pathway protein I